MQMTFSLFGWTGYGYGLALAIAVLLQLLLMGVIAGRQRLPVGTVPVFGAFAIPLGVICARLLFCLINLSLFLETYENPWLMLRFFDGGLSMTGLFLGLLLAALISARLMGVKPGTLLDVMTLPLGLSLALLRAGECFTELGVGKVVEESALTQSAPWLFLKEQVGIVTEYRLAVYAYEALVGVLIFVVMLCVAHTFRKTRQLRAGDIALIFFSLYGATQMLLESMRDDGHMLVTFLRVAQVFAAAMPLIAMGVFTKRYIRMRGKGDKRIVLSWALLLLCVIAGVLLEFSLDGRITWGNPSMLRDYLIMAVLCVCLFIMPYSLFITLSKKSTAEEVECGA